MIGIVVDHPSRDLPSLCILANELLQKNIEVGLIPSYKIDHALLDNPRIFDLIVFNFYRMENYKTILYARSKNIKVAILDQESIGGTDGMGLVNVFKSKILKKYLHFINYYFYPSEQIMRKCLKQNKANPSNNIVTGYQRLDIVKKKISNIKNKNFILICTNFPSVNPGYSTTTNIVKDEIKYRGNNNMIKKLKRDTLDTKLTFKKFSNEILKIINEFKQINFVIRPHPFENKYYWEKFKKYKNCLITNDYNSLEWIKKSLAIIHLDCTTSVEASLLKKPSISIWYTNAKNQSSAVFKLAHECSHLCKSYKILKEKIELAITKSLKFKITPNIKKIFFSPQKTSSSIIVKNILSYNDNTPEPKNIRLNFISYFKFFLEKNLGKKTHDTFLSIYRGRNIAKQRLIKEFSKDLIYKYIPSKTIIVKNKFYYILSRKS